MEINTITIILNNDYSINNVIKKMWQTFITHISQYEIKKNEAILKNNKMLLIDFYNHSLCILKEMNNKTNLLNIENKNIEKNIKKTINNLIQQYLTINLIGIRSIN